MEYTIHTIADRFGLEPILVSYGKSDILLDFVFSLLGTIIVLVFGDDLLQNFYGHTDDSRTLHEHGINSIVS